MRESTIIAAARRALAAHPDAKIRQKDWIGEDSTWEERRLFDWAVLQATAERDGDADTLRYATNRLNACRIEPRVTVSAAVPTNITHDDDAEQMILDEQSEREDGL